MPKRLGNTIFFLVIAVACLWPTWLGLLAYGAIKENADHWVPFAGLGILQVAQIAIVLMTRRRRQ